MDALDEMIEWISDPRPFVKSHHANAWRSADRDLRAARQAAGAATRRLVQAELDAFDIEAALLVAKDNASRTPYIALLTNVRSQVVSDAGLRAMWADVADDLPGRTITELYQRRYSLTRSIKGRGLDASHVYRTMAGVLENRLLDVEEARVRTDSTFKPSTIPLVEKLNADAGLSVLTRLDVCADLLCTPPAIGRYVVWLGIDRATMRAIQLEVNSITFWNSRFVHDTLSVPIEDRADHIPEELRDESAHQTAFPVGCEQSAVAQSASMLRAITSGWLTRSRWPPRSSRVGQPHEIAVVASER